MPVAATRSAGETGVHGDVWEWEGAVGVDVGEGVVVRYDEKAREVVGLTLIGVGRRLEEYIKGA